MRQNTPPLHTLRQQLTEWRRPLDSDPAVDEAVMLMLRALDRAMKGESPDRDGDEGFNPAAAD